MTMRILALLTFAICMQGVAMSQGKTVVIVVMGSSTAAGTGASPQDSSWVNRLIANTRINNADGFDTVVYNLGLGGTTTYVGREIGFVPPQGYAGPDPNRNIDKAVSLTPDIILVNYPSNDVANNIPTATTMENYQVYAARAALINARIIFLSTQPRTALNDAQKIQIRDQGKLILSTYPSNSINVWDFLVASDGFNISSEVSAGDGIHVNNLGHRRIYEAVYNYLNAVNVSSAALPVKLSAFNAEATGKRIDLTWETSSEQNNSHFVVERSSNNRDFIAVGEVKGKGNSNTKTRYKFPDKVNDPGKYFYRLRQVDLDGKTTFSSVISVTVKSVSHALLYPVPATTSINLKIFSEKKENILISLYDRAGNSKSSFSRTMDKGENTFSFPIINLPSGNYFMHINSSGTISKRGFIKL